MIHPIIDEVTKRIVERSKTTRTLYLSQMKAAFDEGITRNVLSCGNLAHGFAGCVADEKAKLADTKLPNFGIVTAYNDMLSAHKTYENYPEKIRKFVISVSVIGLILHIFINIPLLFVVYFSLLSLIILKISTNSVS